ncbi:MAG: agmatinase [Phycisphaerales bacterium]|nr:MAG: agmatinase [Phycisphaerales bacterium]
MSSPGTPRPPTACGAWARSPAPPSPWSPKKPAKAAHTPPKLYAGAMSENFRTRLPDPRLQPRFAGISTFCRYPRLEDVEPAHQPVDWALFGVPFDSAVTYRPGARFGPRAIRDASQYVKHYHTEHDVDLREVLSLADAGDAPVLPYSCSANADSVFDFARGLADPSRTRLLAVGGDHSIAYPCIKAAWERRGRPERGLAMLHFDSHLDTVDAILGERFTHASPFIRAIEDGLIDPKRMLTVGIKGPLNTRHDLDYAKKHGVTVLTYEQWRGGGQRVIDDFVRTLADDEAYLSFDIDCIDPAYAPGTGTPSHGGFTSFEIFQALRSLRGANIVGADVVEVLPDRDVNQNTALLAGHVIFEILALDAVRRSLGTPAPGRE